MNIIAKRQFCFPASPRLIALLLFVIAGVLTAQAEEASNGFSTVFADPPFKVGESVLETGGWYAVGPLTWPENEHRLLKMTPVIAEIPGDGSKTAVIIPSYGIEKRFPEKLQGRVRITSVLQIGPDGSATIYFSPLIGNRLLVNYGCSAKNEGFYYEIPEQSGLGIEGEKPRTIVPPQDITAWEPYTLVMEMNLDADTFDLHITGKKSDGSPLDAVMKDIPLPLPGGIKMERNVSGIRLVGSDNVQKPNIFLESLEVRSAP